MRSEIHDIKGGKEEMFFEVITEMFNALPVPTQLGLALFFGIVGWAIITFSPKYPNYPEK